MDDGSSSRGSGGPRPPRRPPQQPLEVGAEEGSAAARPRALTGKSIETLGGAGVLLAQDDPSTPIHAKLRCALAC